jgi:hypothetical protein
MSERRDFLKTASLLPLSALGANAAVPSPAQQEPGTPSAPSSGLPKTGPVEEQKFENYHLLGKPEPDDNLFGPNRPTEWRATKAALEQALARTAHDNDPIHKWLKVFQPTFDDRAAKVTLDAGTDVFRSGSTTELRYEPELYEASLRGAGVLLDRCLRYRNEMGGFEVAGIGAGISYLTFLKLKPLQRNFIIQSSSADLDEIEKFAQTLTSNNYLHAKGVDKFFEKYHLRALQVEAEGNAQEADLAQAKERLKTRLLEKQFHVNVDAQLAQFTRLLSPGSSSNYAERYLRTLSMLTEDLADSYRKLYSASKGVQGVLGLTQITVGNGSPVPIDIPLFGTADQMSQWIKTIMPPQEGDQRKPDILDALVLWARAAMRELDTRSQYETEFTMPIPLNQPWGKGGAVLVSPAAIQQAFAGAAPTGKVTFTLSVDVLPFTVVPANIRVVGIGLTVEHSQDDAGPVQYASTYPGTPVTRTQPDPMPTQVAAVQGLEVPKTARLSATITTPQQTMAGGTGYMRPAILLTNVRLQGGSGGDMEPQLSYDPSGRNLNPFGPWTIAVNPNALGWYQSAAGFPDNWISGLILHLRLRGSLK